MNIISCSKHRLQVHIRTASTSTHNLCIRARVRNQICLNFPYVLSHKSFYCISKRLIRSTTLEYFIATHRNYNIINPTRRTPLQTVITAACLKRHVNNSFYYANTPMQYTAIFHGCKTVNFQMKIFKIFLIFAKTLIVDTCYNRLTKNLLTYFLTYLH